MIKTKKEDSDSKNTGKNIRVVWRNFPTLQRRNKLKFDKRRTMLHQIQYIIIFDFFYADHSILKPDIATQHNILKLVLAAIQLTFKSRANAATCVYRLWMLQILVKVLTVQITVVVFFLSFI